MLCSLLPDYRRRLCSYTERSSEKSTYLCLVSRFLTATGKRGVDKGGRERGGGGDRETQREEGRKRERQKMSKITSSSSNVQMIQIMSGIRLKNPIFIFSITQMTSVGISTFTFAQMTS